MASATPRNKHRSVFIGNIPYHVEEKQLIEICEEIGPVVSFRLVMDNKTGKRKGYGFCEYLDEETALSARRNLQGYMVRGRQLCVDLANNEKDADRNRDQGQGDAGVEPNLGTTQPPTGNAIPANPAASQPNDVLSALAVVLTMEDALVEMQSELANQQGFDPLTTYLSKLSNYQLLEIISTVKFLATHHKPCVRQYLQQNPKLLRAQNQAEAMLGLATSATIQSSQHYPFQHSQSEILQQPMTSVSVLVQPRSSAGSSNWIVPQSSSILAEAPLPPLQHQAGSSNWMVPQNLVALAQAPLLRPQHPVGWSNCIAAQSSTPLAEVPLLPRQHQGSLTLAQAPLPPPQHLAENSNWSMPQNSLPLAQAPMPHPQQPAGWSNCIVAQCSTPLAQAPLPFPQQSALHQAPKMPLGHVPPQHLQKQAAPPGPTKPFQETSQFSYCRRVGATTAVDLQADVRSWSELRPTKIRKLV